MIFFRARVKFLQNTSLITKRLAPSRSGKVLLGGQQKASAALQHFALVRCNLI
jgi:hypothetical protein